MEMSTPFALSKSLPLHHLDSLSAAVSPVFVSAAPVRREIPSATTSAANVMGFVASQTKLAKSLSFMRIRKYMRGETFASHKENNKGAATCQSGGLKKKRAAKK